jgi:hypothetical protein
MRRPLVTEKTTVIREDGRTLVFEVARDANKIDHQAGRGAAARLEGAERPHVAVARQGQAAGALRGTPARLEEGLRDAARGEKLPDFLQGA